MTLNKQIKEAIKLVGSEVLFKFDGYSRKITDFNVHIRDMYNDCPTSGLVVEELEEESFCVSLTCGVEIIPLKYCLTLN